MSRGKAEIIKSLEDDLKKERALQITDIWATFPTRLARHVKIQLIKFTLNNHKL